jgi:transposase
MVGCDLHDKSMLLKIAMDRGNPVVRSWGTDVSARAAMIADLKRRAAQVGAKRIVFAYEACGFGFLLHDELAAAGIECHVLAPSKMERSAKHRKRKTDERDAQAILNYVRSYVLAGVELPSVWIPDLMTRDDRELIRLRLAVAEDGSAFQTRIRWLLKRNGIESAPAKAWTEAYWKWLEELPGSGSLRPGASATLESLMRQVQSLRSEKERLDAHVLALSRTARFAPVVSALRRHKGAGVLTAMVFLTEMGDLSRFANRQQVGSYLGLTPSSFETGQDADRKGHITHQGPSRVRKVLCQAVWSRLRTVESERYAYDRIVTRNPKHKKIAVVARMRTLGIVLWHHGLEAQLAMKAQSQPRGGGRETFRAFFGVKALPPPADPLMPRRCVSPTAAATRPPLKEAEISN